MLKYENYVMLESLEVLCFLYAVKYEGYVVVAFISKGRFVWKLPKYGTKKLKKWLFF